MRRTGRMSRKIAAPPHAVVAGIDKRENLAEREARHFTSAHHRAAISSQRAQKLSPRFPAPPNTPIFWRNRTLAAKRIWLLICRVFTIQTLHYSSKPCTAPRRPPAFSIARPPARARQLVAFRGEMAAANRRANQPTNSRRKLATRSIEEGFLGCVVRLVRTSERGRKGRATPLGMTS